MAFMIMSLVLVYLFMTFDDLCPAKMAYYINIQSTGRFMLTFVIVLSYLQVFIHNTENRVTNGILNLFNNTPIPWRFSIQASINTTTWRCDWEIFHWRNHCDKFWESEKWKTHKTVIKWWNGSDLVNHICKRLTKIKAKKKTNTFT